MKSEYKILWFEDQFDEVSGDFYRVKDLVSEYGFIPDIVHKDSITADEIEALSSQLSSYNPYDLIIFDYDLGGNSENGLSIASHLRSKIFTDMIFYSGQVPKELRSMLYDSEVDGVFIVHRNSFYDDVEPIIEDHIKKISDINNMRGVVMSETSKMDLAIRELLISWSNNASKEERQKALIKIKGRLYRDLDNKKKKIEKTSSLEEIVGDYLITTFDNVRVSLKDSLEVDKKGDLENNSLLHTLQTERNILAHCKSELNDEGKMIVFGKETKEYNFDEFKRLRNQILQVHEKIKNLVS